MDEYSDWLDESGYDGVDYAVPRDNSQGAPAMTTSTPTGNGSGVYIPGTNWGATLQNVLNYAMVRDQQRMNQVQTAPIRAVQTQAAQARATDSRVFMYLLIGAAIYMAVK